MEQKRAIIVDDEEVICNLTADLLRDDGYRVTTANDGTTAIEAMNRERFDLLLTDLKMPGLDGLDLIQTAQSIHPDIIAIIMTGCATLDTARKAVQRRAYDYILKPFNVVELRRAVSSAFERKRLIEENARLRELTGLFKVSEAISATIDREDLIRLILNSAIIQTKGHRGSIMLFDEEMRELSVAAAIGLSTEELLNCEVNLKVGIYELVVPSGQPMIITKIEGHPLLGKLCREHPDRFPIEIPDVMDEELIIVPIKTSEKILGVINVSKKLEDGMFNEGDVELLTVLASQAAISLENSRLFSNLQETYLNTVQSLALLIEAKDVYIKGHSQRVTDLCVKIGQKLNLAPRELVFLRYGAGLHDIGKIGISESILKKKGTLTSEERKMVEKHPIIGDEVLKPIKFLVEARQMIRHHHERLDGSGYPDGIIGDQLSRLTRIIIVADVYDAMSSDRAYRKALPSKRIFEELMGHRGTWYDSSVVETLMDMIEV